MVLPLALGLIAIAVVVFALVWGWRHGTLRSTEQERIDFEFARIVRRLDSSTG